MFGEHLVDFAFAFFLFTCSVAILALVGLVVYGAFRGN